MSLRREGTKRRQKGPAKADKKPLLSLWLVRHEFFSPAHQKRNNNNIKCNNNNNSKCNHCQSLATHDGRRAVCEHWLQMLRRNHALCNTAGARLPAAGEHSLFLFLEWRRSHSGAAFCSFASLFLGRPSALDVFISVTFRASTQSCVAAQQKHAKAIGRPKHFGLHAAHSL